MARLFLEVFGDELLIQPFAQNESVLPSPEALKRKILIKHRKLPEGSDETTPILTNVDERKDDINALLNIFHIWFVSVGGEIALSNSQKNGILYQRNPVDSSKWLPQLFVLIRDRLCYSEERILEADDEDDDSQESSANGSSSNAVS